MESPTKREIMSMKSTISKQTFFRSITSYHVFMNGTAIAVKIIQRKWVGTYLITIWKAKTRIT